MANRKTVQEKLEAAKQKINNRYDATYQDILDIVNGENRDCVGMICIAFQYGYLQGSKATKKKYEAARAKARDNI